MIDRPFSVVTQISPNIPCLIFLLLINSLGFFLRVRLHERISLVAEIPMVVDFQLHARRCFTPIEFPLFLQFCLHELSLYALMNLNELWDLKVFWNMSLSCLGRRDSHNLFTTLLFSFCSRSRYYTTRRVYTNGRPKVGRDRGG